MITASWPTRSPNVTAARDQAWSLGVPWELRVRDPASGKLGTRVFGALDLPEARTKARRWEASRGATP